MTPAPIGSKIAALHEMQSALLEPTLRAEELSWAAFQLLVTISGTGGTAAQVDVARDLGVTPATLSESVHSLVKRGLIEQVPGERDRRVKTLRLTSSAVHKLAMVRAAAAASEKAMVEGVPARDLEACSRVLDILIGRLELVLGTGD